MRIGICIAATGWMVVSSVLAEPRASAQHAMPRAGAAIPRPSLSLLERKNIDKLSADELKAYAHAIDVLKKSSDPTQNYQFFADAHDSFTANHGCEHGNELFFPWHRSLLYYFEQALRNADTSGTSGLRLAALRRRPEPRPNLFSVLR